MVARAVVVVVLATVASSCSGVGLPCVSDKNCPQALFCVAEQCAEHRANVKTGLSIRTFDVAGANLVPGSSPRIFVHDGVVDVYALIAPCGSLARLRPLSGTLDVIATPDAPSCFSELDAARTADGVVHAVVHATVGAGSAAEALEIDDSGLLGSPVTFAPAQASEQRGMSPRVALDASGNAQAVWAYQRDAEIDVEKLALPALGQPTLATVLASAPGGLAVAFDTSAAEAVFSQDDDPASGARLRATYRTERVIAGPVSRGAIDAVSCAGALFASYRTDHEVLVARVDPLPPASALIIEDKLAVERTPGDVAVACDAGKVWLTHAAGGTVRLYPDTEGAASIIDSVDDGSGAVSLAVVDGVAHLAYATVGGTVRYAVVTQ